MTARMFEYALVSEEEETPDFTCLSTGDVLQYLRENCEYIRLAGFHTHCRFSEESASLTSDRLMLKRIFTNLFSNILKYGDKEQPVEVSCALFLNREQIHISIKNTIRQEYSFDDSNNIGLRNVQKMAELLHGHLEMERSQEVFTIHLTFPLKKKNSSPFRLTLRQ